MCYNKEKCAFLHRFDREQKDIYERMCRILHREEQKQERFDMVFSSLFFLYLFLPVCLLCYGLSPSLTVKNLTLTVFSLIFYAWGEPVWVLMLVAYSYCCSQAS